MGHSLGGLIIRAALPHLSDYSAQMFTLMTFSSPHLGFLYHDDTLFKTGLKIFSQFDSSVVLKQLTFKDAEQVPDGYLFKLAKEEGVGWFRNVVLVNSL